MKTTWFITAAALAFSGLATAQTQGKSAAASSASNPFTIPTPNWMEQHQKEKTGRYSPAEEKRQEDARSSTAFRDNSQPVTQLSPIEQHYMSKLGRLPGR
jgi:hypothetical protein